MSKIQLYGGRNGSSLRCHWALAELGVDYDNVPLNMREREHKKESFLALNPNGQVPVLVDGDFVLAESIAINNYLAEKFGPELAGVDVKERALVMQRSLWCSYNIQHNLHLMVSYRWSGSRDEASIAHGKSGLDRFMPILDKALEGKKFLVGDHFTLADINVASALTYNTSNDYDMTPYQNVVAWMNAMCERPSYKQAREGAKG